MELPGCYFPIRLCQHNEEDGQRRRNFAEYGSYTQVDVYPHVEERPLVNKCHPQKGLGIIKGLRDNLPPLPLYDRPIQEHRVIHDHILGVDNFDDTMQSLNNFLRGVQSAKAELYKGKVEFVNRIDKCQRLVDACLQDPSHPGYLEKLQKELPFWMTSLLRNYSKTSTALNDDCLMGFNRDFYGGLLCHKQSPSSTILFHATGDEFKDIYMTEVSLNEGHLAQGKQLSKTTLKRPVFQLKCSKKGVLYARHKRKCTMLAFDESERSFGACISSTSENNTTLSDVTPSPYNSDEVLLSGKNKYIALWNINAKCPWIKRAETFSLKFLEFALPGYSCKTLLHKGPELESQDSGSWTSSYFAGHPRQVVVADCSTVELFDHRDRFQKGLELFTLSSSYVKDYELVMATDGTPGFPHHLVATNHTLFLMDQRFPRSPVLHWCSETITAPQLLQCCQVSNQGNARMARECDWWVFTGAQQPAEVVCYPLHLAKGQAPVTKTLPWQVGKLGVFASNQHTSYISQRLDIDKCFQSSLAGMTVVDESIRGNEVLSVYQMDGYGDIYFQNYKLSKDLVNPGCYNVKTPSVDERSAANQRATNFLLTLDTKHRPEGEASCSRLNTGKDLSLTYRMMESVMSGATETSTSEEMESPGLTYTQLESTVCSRKTLNKMHDLVTSGANTRLLLALKDKQDIQEVLEEREKDHQEKRLALRDQYLNNKTFSVPRPFKKKRKVFPGVREAQVKTEDEEDKEFKVDECCDDRIAVADCYGLL